MREFTNKNNPRNKCAKILAYFKDNREAARTADQINRAIFQSVCPKEMQSLRGTCVYLKNENNLRVVGKEGQANLYGPSRDQLQIWADEENKELDPEVEVLTSDEDRKKLLRAAW